MNTITKIPILTPTTNTIIKSSIYSEINIIKDDPDNNINGKNAAKRKEKALQQKEATSVRSTENTNHQKLFNGEGNNDADNSSSSNSSNSNSDSDHDCPQYQWEHWSKQTFDYDKTYKYNRHNPVDTYIPDDQDH